MGQIAWRLQGKDYRGVDLPGGSGVFRRLGPLWGIGVALGDGLKGVLVALLAQGHPSLLPWMGLAVVLGHNWPIFFRFYGGGGLATSLGFLLWVDRPATLVGLGVTLGVAGLYWALYWRIHRNIPYPLPFGAIFGFLAYLVFSRGAPQAFLAGLLLAGAVFLKSLQFLLSVYSKP
jgi:glycerol-3-phosphate acyltransferase PlsY